MNVSNSIWKLFGKFDNYIEVKNGQRMDNELKSQDVSKAWPKKLLHFELKYLKHIYLNKLDLI